MGKWTKLKKQLKELPVEAEYQTLVDQVKRPLLGKDHVALALQLGRTKRNKAKLEEKIRLMNIEIAAHEQLLVEYLENTDQTQFRTRSGVLISLKDDVYPQVKNQPVFFQWIKRNRYAYLLSVHHKRLESLVKQLLEEGKRLPEGVDVFMKTTISYRGKNQKGE
jgi:hypothetical protein